MKSQMTLQMIPENTFWSADEIIRLKEKGINTDLLNLNQPQRNFTPEQLQDMYLDYMNNFLTVIRFAEYYNISEIEANEVIEKGEVAHAEYLFNKHNKISN